MARKPTTQGLPVASDTGNGTNDWRTADPGASNLEPDRRSPWPILQIVHESEHGTPALWSSDERVKEWPAPWRPTPAAFNGEEESGTAVGVQVLGAVLCARRRWVDRKGDGAPRPWNAYVPGYTSHVQVAMAFTPEQVGILTGKGSCSQSLWTVIDGYRKRYLEPAKGTTGKDWPTYAWKVRIGIGDEQEGDGQYGKYRFTPYAWEYESLDVAFVGHTRMEAYRTLYNNKGREWVRQWDAFEPRNVPSPRDAAGDPDAPF